MARHNGGRNEYTKRGVPWTLVWGIEKATRSEAMHIISYFFKINGQITGCLDVNEFLVQKCDNSDDTQCDLLDVLGEAFENLIALFLNYQQEAPTIMKVKYYLSGELTNPIGSKTWSTNNFNWSFLGNIF